MSQVGDQIAFGVIGDVDAAATAHLRNQLLTLAKQHPGSIDVDLSASRLWGPACTAVLVETWRFAQEHGIELTVRSPSADIADAFDMTPSGALLTLRG